MPEIAANFGFYPARLSLRAGDLSIDTRADFDESTADFENWEGIEKDWIYPPLQHRRTLGGAVRELPYPSRVFGLPKTHTMIHAGADSSAHLEFHIWALSFFLGMRLTTTEAGFLDATPIKPHKLVDFHLSRADLPKAIALAEQFWVHHRHEPLRAKWLVAAVHALFVAQYPQSLQFERFIYLYTALDACYALAASIQPPVKKPSHSDRINWMCNLFRMTTPDWALESSGTGAEVASIRNATLHEALFMDKPLGFVIHGTGSSKNLPLEMEAFVCRLLVALIGREATTYVRSPVNTRMEYSLDLR